MCNSKKISLDKESLCNLNSVSKNFFSDIHNIYEKMSSNREYIKKTQERVKTQLKKGVRQTNGTF